jgi:general secretion pathway protein A
MYQVYYNLCGIPFEKNIQVKQLFSSVALQEFLSRMDYMKQVKGLFLLTGMPGVGKTTALRAWVEELKPELYKIVYLQLSTVSTSDFYHQINKALGGQHYSRKSDIFSSIQELIMNYATVKKQLPVIILDEIQLIRQENLFELQMLLNFNFDSLDPAIVILCGQTFVREKLLRPNLNSINQRFRIKYEMPTLNKEETKNYLLHHLKLVNASENIFNQNALDALFNASSGNLRNINRIAINALMFGASQRLDIITEDIIYKTTSEL